MEMAAQNLFSIVSKKVRVAVVVVVRSRLWSRRVPGSKSDFAGSRRVLGLLHVKSRVVAKLPPVGVAWKFGEGVPAQVSSESDRSLKLRGPS
ncbi:hypothetical protein AVEN_79703-1 [Araneus ventricosus]|uniref:Uncharacterized protein n=1 Tax=Araneus ventricosus TaxID=182803 RepID=A0A4Y1ZSW9_ARAVE|nr:hypothetical protein AVEN_79703-1 [Araneus ventricosus]